METVVADGEVSHVWEHTYLLWFDRDLNPHLETTKPPPKRALAEAKWAVGVQGVGLHEGHVRSNLAVKLDSQTAIGFDPARKRLFLAVFEKATVGAALEEIASLGALEGVTLDSGGSSCLAIGAGAAVVAPGVVTGGWRPVATVFGVRSGRD